MNSTFLNKFFSMNVVVICGMLIALYVFSLTSELRPISSFLFDPMLYVVSSLIALSVRIILWIFVDKGTLYDASHNFLSILQDCVVINVVLLCTLSFLFLITSFL